ncbi:MAG: YbaB/EbfC family nucleoid-associated protein [Candidatus Omnitrophota bacterium]|jgi:hypothetical protein
MLDKMKALMDMQKKMQEMKRQLDSAEFKVESPDGTVNITMNGSQEIKDITISADLKAADKAALERSLKDVYNAAIKRSHDIAAAKMKGITGLNLPGL